VPLIHLTPVRLPAGRPVLGAGRALDRRRNGPM